MCSWSETDSSANEINSSPGIVLIVEYDGTKYSGWQIQKNAPTVQAAIEKAIWRLTGEDLRIRGASRTDCGVHARGQICLVPSLSTIPAERFAQALNTRLPADIVVKCSYPAKPGFDPRHSAKRKCYTYSIWNHPIRPVLERHFYWHVRYLLQRDKMQKAAELLVGHHDFTSFCNGELGGIENDNHRTLDSCTVSHTKDNPQIVITVEARSFLYNQVRIMAGTLVDVGSGRFLPEAIPEIFAARSRAASGQTAPSCGLCLEWIAYN